MSENLPSIEIVHRGRGKDDPTPYLAEAWFFQMGEITTHSGQQPKRLF